MSSPGEPQSPESEEDDYDVNEHQHLFEESGLSRMASMGPTAKPFTESAFHARFNIVQTHQIGGVKVSTLTKEDLQAPKYIVGGSVKLVDKEKLDKDIAFPDLENSTEVSHFKTVFDDKISAQTRPQKKAHSLHVFRSLVKVFHGGLVLLCQCMPLVCLEE